MVKPKITTVGELRYSETEGLKVALTVTRKNPVTRKPLKPEAVWLVPKPALSKYSLIWSGKVISIASPTGCWNQVVGRKETSQMTPIYKV